MAGIFNRTARLFNLKTLRNGKRTIVRLAPGFNIVDNELWKQFVDNKENYIDPYVAELEENDSISFGKKQDQQVENGKEASTKSMTKSETIPPKVRDPEGGDDGNDDDDDDDDADISYEDFKKAAKAVKKEFSEEFGLSVLEDREIKVGSTLGRSLSKIDKDDYKSIISAWKIGPESGDDEDEDDL